MNYFPAIILAALVAAPAHAVVVGLVDASGGAVIELHDTAGPCVATALLAFYRPAGTTRDPVPGCWVLGQGGVMVSFLDGDVARIPISAVKKATPA